VERLEEVFEELGEKTKGKTCQAMKGLIEEGSEVLKAGGEDSVIDAGIIVAAQKVEAQCFAVFSSRLICRNNFRIPQLHNQFQRSQ